MVETWLQLQAQQAARFKTSEAVEGIRKDWDGKNEGHDEATRFDDTYDEVVEALRKRYTEPTENSWLSGNADLVKKFDELFAKLKTREVNLAEIETEITKEKQKWYRQTLPGSVAGAIAEKSMGRGAYLGTLDESTDWDGATKRMQRALDDYSNLPALDDLTRKLNGLEGEQRIKTLIDVFFRDPQTGEVPRSCLASVEALHGGASLEETMSKLQQSRAGAGGAKSEAERHRRTLADLKRAQAAHEQNKMAKAKSRQRDQGPRIEAETYENLPGGANLENVMACSLCQLNASLGLGRGHVYASTDMNNEEHEAHVRAHHECAARERCIQLTDEDVDMTGDQGSGIVMCKECAEDLKQATVYCASRCASSDFKRHREEVHLPARRGSNRSVESDTKHLVFHDGARDDYHVEDIRQFTWGIEEAADRILKERNPDMEIKSLE